MKSFNLRTTAEVQKAIDAIKQNHDLDITEKTRVNASEFANAGYIKVPNHPRKGPERNINEEFRSTKGPDTIHWIDAGSSADLPIASYSPGRSKLGYNGT